MTTIDPPATPPRRRRTRFAAAILAAGALVANLPAGGASAAGPVAAATRAATTSLAHPAPAPPVTARASTTAAPAGVVEAEPAGVVPAEPAGVLPAEPAGVVLAAPADVSPATLPATDVAPDRPSQMYLDLQAHANDRIAFVPGGRVSIPFVPRAGDRWLVGGAAPRALPAGRLSGAEMDAAATAGARPPTTRPVPDASPLPPAPAPPTAAPPTAAPAPPAASTPPGGPAAPPVASAPPAGSPAPAATPAASEPATTPTPGPAGAAAPADRPIDAPGGVPSTDATAAARIAQGTGPDVAADATSLRRDVYGFLPYWEVGNSTTRLDYRVLSHVAYFSVGADRAGNLLKTDSTGKLTTGWAGWTSSAMTKVIQDAHAAHTRVTLTISVFAWTAGQKKVQSTLLGSPAARANLAAQAVAAVRDRGADGINLDFESLAAGQEANFVALIRTIRADFAAIAPGYHLTLDTLGRPGNYPLETAVGAGAADAIMIMGYDYRIASSGYAGSIDPLSGPAYDLADTIAAYRARVPASRLILGVPYYGRAWPTVSSSRNARTQTGTKFGPSAAVNYESSVPLAAKYGRRLDTREYSAWFTYRTQNCTTTYGCVATWRQVYYDDAATLKARYDLVNRAGIRGIGIWALGYDGTRPELDRALVDKFINDTTPPLAGITVLPPSQQDAGFGVAWNAIDDFNGIASYDVQVSVDGGAWTTWLAGTTATSATWLGDDAHGYAFRVRARDGKANVGPYDVTSTYTAPPTLAPGTGFGQVVADLLNVRAGPSTGDAVLTTAAAGSLFAITAGPRAADGCTWYEVTGPLVDWGPTGTVLRNAWVAATCGATTYLRAALAPNATQVVAGIRNVAFGGATEAASIGPGAGATANRSFSPNGDASRDTLPVTWNNRFAFDSLEARILAPDGTLLGSLPLAGDLAAGAHATSWGGQLAGARVADGTYVLQLVGVAGGVTSTWPSPQPTAALVAATGVAVDTLAPVLTSGAVSGSRISPNADGRYDTLTIRGAATGATHWVLEVAPAAGGPAARSITGGGAAADATWDGKASDGTPVADGVWTLTLRFLDDAGNAVGTSFVATVDTRPPAVTSSVDVPAFSPNGDGALERATLTWKASEPSTGSLRITHGTSTVKAWSLAGTSGAIAWDGRNARGAAVADGRYTLRVDLVDAAGNRTSRSTIVAVDRTASQLRWSPALFFPQDGDALATFGRVSFRLARGASTTLVVRDAAGTVVRTAWRSRTRSAGTVAWRWDGRDGAGRFVPRGRYTAALTVVGRYGTVVLLRTVVADAFAASASSARPVAGTTLSVTFRSAEALAGAPTATFRQAGQAAVAMKVARLSGGAWRASVVVATGAPGPAKVDLTARDASGHRNTSSLSLAVP